MKDQLEKQLAAKFPKILKDLGGDPMKTCMALGLECGDGWYGLLEDGMGKIQYYCNRCTTAGEPVQLVADQIKEKFGTLSFRYHVEGGTQVAHEVLSKVVGDMERMSEGVCEVSGAPGVLCSKDGWLATRSREEARKSGYKAQDKNRERYWVGLDAKDAKDG